MMWPCPLAHDQAYLLATGAVTQSAYTQILQWLQGTVLYNQDRAYITYSHLHTILYFCHAQKLLQNIFVFRTEPQSINPSYAMLSASIRPARYILDTSLACFTVYCLLCFTVYLFFRYLAYLAATEWTSVPTRQTEQSVNMLICQRGRSGDSKCRVCTHNGNLG